MTGSLDGSCILPAAGKDWHFKLTIASWMKLQKAFGNVGPTRINARFEGEDWTIEDIREVIERGLEGGGVAPGDCGAIATGIIDAQPLTQNLQLAVDIITAGWTGMDELLKKKAAIAAATVALSKMAMGNGNSATSSVLDFSPESNPPKPSDSASGNISP